MKNLNSKFDEDILNKLYNDFIEIAKSNGYEYEFSKSVGIMQNSIILKKYSDDNTKGVFISLLQTSDEKASLNYRFFDNGWQPFKKLNINTFEINKGLFQDINSQYETM